jgi:hypothetical protein
VRNVSNRRRSQNHRNANLELKRREYSVLPYLKQVKKKALICKPRNMKTFISGLRIRYTNLAKNQQKKLKKHHLRLTE